MCPLRFFVLCIALANEQFAPKNLKKLSELYNYYSLHWKHHIV